MAVCQNLRRFGRRTPVVPKLWSAGYDWRVRTAKPRFWLHLAVTAAVFLSAAAVHGDGEVPGLLFQGGILVPPVPVVVDPKLPRGPTLQWSARPTSDARLCSATYPVCVHGGEPTLRASTLERLQMAFMNWSYVLNRPSPLGDLALGGGPEIDVYLTKQTSPLEVSRDAPRLSSARSSGFCTLDSNTTSEHWLTVCVAELAALGLNAASGDGMRRGWAAYQVQPLTGHDSASALAVDLAQANPQATLLSAKSSALSPAGSLFWGYLDANLGAGPRGELPCAMLTLSRQQELTLSPHPQWDNAPDELDVLRRAFNNDAQRVSDTLVNFAVSRAFLGDRSDGAHRPPLTALGEQGRVRFD